jgi:hypothetical protein
MDAKGTPLTEEEIRYIETKAGIPFRDRFFRSPREEILQRRAEEQFGSGRISGNSMRTSWEKRSKK